jgi:hypothetical protein
MSLMMHIFYFLLRTYWSLTKNGESGLCSGLCFHHVDLLTF